MHKHAAAVEVILRKLAKGCPEHPSYRYKRMPKCPTCVELFQERQRLDALDEADRQWQEQEQKNAVAWDKWRDALLTDPAQRSPKQ